MRKRSKRKNPVPQSKQVMLDKAGNLYYEFTGQNPKIWKKIDKPEIPDVLLLIGKLSAVEYDARRDGKMEYYRHEFTAKSRPLLCSTPDGNQLVIVGGHYDFTERGIVDRRE